MTLKELSQYYWLVREMERDRVRLEQMRLGADLGAVTLTGMPHGTGVSDPTGQRGMALADLERLLDEKYTRCAEECLRIETYISTVEDSLTRQIMELRFVEFLTWDQVAVRIGGGNSSSSVKMRVYRYLRATDEDVERGDTIPENGSGLQPESNPGVPSEAEPPGA